MTYTYLLVHVLTYFRQFVVSFQKFQHYVLRIGSGYKIPGAGAAPKQAGAAPKQASSETLHFFLVPEPAV